jgi:hypothetical protein
LALHVRKHRHPSDKGRGAGHGFKYGGSVGSKIGRVKRFRPRLRNQRRPRAGAPGCTSTLDLGPATIDGLKSGYVTATLDQLLYLQGFMPVLQCVLTAKYKMPGLSLNTGAGTVTPETIDSLVELIDAGIR